MLILVLQIKKRSPFLHGVCMQCQAIYIFDNYKLFRPLFTTFDGYILILPAIYYFKWLYTTFDGYILLSAAIYYFRRKYTTFNGYILLLTAMYYLRPYILPLALPVFCKNPRLSSTPRICRLKARLEFNINFLEFIQFAFSVVQWLFL